MALCKIRPSKLAGLLRIPASKSHSMRAILLASLCSGKSHLRDVLHSPDVAGMIRVCRMLGAKITEHQNHSYSVEGVAGRPRVPEDVVDAGNSGILFRFVAAIAGLCKGYTVLTGDESIRTRRPIAPLLKAMRQLGASAESARGDGHAPIIVKGPLLPGKTDIVAEDSQVLSALLIAASFMPGVTHVHAQNLGEMPWVQLTLDWLETLGVQFDHNEFEHFTVHGKQERPSFTYTVPGDFSSAAFPLVAGIVTGSELTLTHLDMDDNQGDKKLIDLLGEMGAQLEVQHEAQRVLLKPRAHLIGREVDVNPIIDALPILAVAGCFAEGETHLINAGIARKKESDRIAAIAVELKKMGADIEEEPEGLRIRKSELHGAELESHADHRISMALAVAALAAKGESTLHGIECVNKSYADFFTHLRVIGADLEIIH